MYTEHQSWPELFLAVRRVSSSTSRKVFLRIATAAMLRGLHLVRMEREEEHLGRQMEIA